MQIEQKTIPVP